MASLTTRRPPRPDPSKTFECILGYSGPTGSYSAGVQLLGSHPAVVASPGYWMDASLPDDVRAEARTAALFGRTEPGQGPAPFPIARPPSDPMVAVGNYQVLEVALAGPRVLYAGTVVDASDALYRTLPHLFEPAPAEETS